MGQAAGWPAGERTIIAWTDLSMPRKVQRGLTRPCKTCPDLAGLGEACSEHSRQWDLEEEERSRREQQEGAAGRSRRREQKEGAAGGARVTGAETE